MTTLQSLKKEMIPLQNQELFERLIGRIEEEKDSLPLPTKSIVYFTAKWWGACKRLNLPKLLDDHSQYTWFKCDIDVNEYTAGFCGIQQIPTFIMINNKKIVGRISNSDTATVSKWILETV